MPLNLKGKKILKSMRKTYGKRAEEVFYRSKNAGKISGVEGKSHKNKKKIAKAAKHLFG